MSDIGDLLKEAIFGDAPFDDERSRQTLQSALDAFERRLKIIRIMAWTAVTLASAGVAGTLVAFFRTPPEDVRSLIAWAGLFIFATSIVGFVKMWLFNMQNHLALMKELKRLQVAVAEATPKSGG